MVSVTLTGERSSKRLKDNLGIAGKRSVAPGAPLSAQTGAGAGVDLASQRGA